MAVVAIAAIAVGVGVYAATRTITVPGQKLGEIARQTAKEGEPRIIVFGIVRPIGGNLVAVEEPPRIIRKKQKSGGKGGGGSKTYTEVPVRTYAVGICEGPITGIRRIWRNNKLVYDRTGTAWGGRNGPTFMQTARFYLGGWDQMPSPDLEAVFGAGNVPAMRGTAYMVMANEELADTGGAVPQWTFEVERAEGYLLTSPPYPVEDIQATALVGAGADSGYLATPAEIEEMDASSFSGGGVVAGELRTARKGAAALDESVQAGGAVISGEFRTARKEAAADEETAVIGGGVISGEFRSALIKHTYPPEATGQMGGGVIGGVHG